MYEDTLHLLMGAPDFWISFTQSKVFLPYERVYDTAIGVYNWAADVHVFTLQTYGNVIIVCGGSIEDADWNFYTIDPELGASFNAVQWHCRDALRSIQKMDA